MSILRSKHSGWTHESTRTPFFGGGGGGGPTQTTSTSQTSNIPDYAQPYVENMLESTQRQIYTTDPVTGERTGFKPYVPYSRNASDYVAPFQPLQVQAQQGIANLQVPGEYKQAIGLTGLGTMGSMGLAGQGVSAAQQGFGAGQQYANQMQDPASMASYMNPYQQNVTDVAKAAAVREAQIAQSAGNLGAARQGTYGGARQTLANTERERNLLSNLSNIQAQGSNQAYQQAVANQQFGANLGLQGLQAGYGGLGLGLQGYGQTMQGAGQIGQLGGAELKAQQDLYGLKNQYGGQQQAQEQQKISQAIQDFANQQQYPLMQLGTMSNMLRGLPMQSANTNQYVAAPNALTQGIGLAGAGASIYNALKKEGGVIKEMRSGGITSIPRYDVGGSVRAKLEMMPLKELQEYKSGSPAIQEMVEEVLRDKTGKAGGGIIAFQNRGEVEDPEMVRQAYIDAAALQAANNPPVEAKKIFPTGVGPVNVGPTNIPSLDTVIANRQLGLPKDFPSELSYEADRARSDFQQKVVEQGGQLKPTTKFTGTSTVPMTDEQRMTRFRAALDQNTTAPKTDVAKQNDKPSAPAAAPAAAPVVAAPPVVANAPPKGIAPAPGVAPAPVATPAGILQADPRMLPAMPVEKTQEELEKGAEARVKAANIDQNSAEARKSLTAERANAVDEARRISALRMAEFFGAWGSTPGNTITAGLNTLKNKIPDFITDQKEATKMRKAIDKDIADLDKLDREEKKGIRKDYFAEQQKIADRAEKSWGTKYNGAVQLAVSANQLKGSLASANRATDLDRDAEAYFNDLVKNNNMDPKNPATMRIARQKAREGANPYAQERLDVQKEAVIANKEKGSKDLSALNMQLTQYMFGELTDAEKVEKARIEQAIITEKQKIRDDVYKKPTTTAPVAAPAPAPVTAAPIKNNDGTITIPSGDRKGTYQPQPDGTFKKIG